MTDHHSIDCEEVVARLLTYLDGELDAETRAHIDHHIEQCHGCYSRAQFERTLRRRLQELGHEPPSERLTRRLKSLLDSF
jgi:anti-sigma factor (TIGR02949 family)